MRIVSLLPSATEILHAVGAGGEVVGVTLECDSPADARSSAKVVSVPTVPSGATPAQIDRIVRRRLRDGEDLYHLDRAALSGLDADVVVTQDLCAVCAVDTAEVRDALDYLDCHADVVTTDPQTLAEVWDSIEQIGLATGHADDAAALALELRTRVATIALATRGPRPRCLLLEWTDPPYAPGHWLPEMVRTAGGCCVLGEAGAPARPTSWRSVAASEPEVVVLAPCGFDLPSTVDLGRELLADGDPAVPFGDAASCGARRLPPDVPVWAVDASASFARPGPRLADGIEALARILHPELGAPDPSMAQRLR